MKRVFAPPDIDLNEIESLVEQKLVTRRSHPTLPLDIYNYTPGAVYDIQPANWDETLSWCRGLVINRESGGIAARGFKKFWNIEQVADNLPPGEPQFYEKVDGSLIIAFLHDGQLVMASRGSFQSDQVHEARRIASTYPGLADLMRPGYSYLFEVVYPENRIVVDYGEARDLIALAVISTEDGKDDPREWHLFTSVYPGPTVAKYPLMDLRKAGVDNENGEGGEDSEGYVLIWPNGFRAKFKFENYKRLHRLLTGLTARDIWRMLKDGDNRAIEESKRLAPVAKFREWVDATAEGLRYQFSTIVTDATTAFIEERPSGFSRAEFAAWAKTKPWPHLLFALYDTRPIDEMVWKMIYPAHSTPFMKEDPE